MKSKGTHRPTLITVKEWCKDNEVRAARINSIAALSELLRGFNEIIYKNYIKPTQAG